jgi:predicted secreted protein
MYFRQVSYEQAVVPLSVQSWLSIRRLDAWHVITARGPCRAVAVIGMTTMMLLMMLTVSIAIKQASARADMSVYPVRFHGKGTMLNHMLCSRRSYFYSA